MTKRRRPCHVAELAIDRQDRRHVRSLQPSPPPPSEVCRDPVELSDFWFVCDEFRADPASRSLSLKTYAAVAAAVDALIHTRPGNARHAQILTHSMLFCCLREPTLTPSLTTTLDLRAKQQSLPAPSLFSLTLARFTHSLTHTNSHKRLDSTAGAPHQRALGSRRRRQQTTASTHTERERHTHVLDTPQAMIAKDSRFVRKVYLIVTQEDAAVVSWTPDGRAFTIHDTAGFQRAIKSKYHLSSLCTFRQNLRAHGFEEIELTRDDDDDDRDHRDGSAGRESTQSNNTSTTQRQQSDAVATVKKEQNTLQVPPSEPTQASESTLPSPPPETYYHPCFVRGRPELLAQITFDARLKFRCQECKRHPNERGAKCSTRRRESVSGAGAEAVKSTTEASSDKEETGDHAADRPASPPRHLSVADRPEWRRPLDALAHPMVASSSASSLRVTLRALPPPLQQQQQRATNSILALSDATSVYSNASVRRSDDHDSTNSSSSSTGHDSRDMLPASSGAFLRPSPASLKSHLIVQSLANERAHQPAQVQSNNIRVGLSTGPVRADAVATGGSAAADRKPPTSDESLMVRLSFGRQDAGTTTSSSGSSSRVPMPVPPSLSERSTTLPTVATGTKQLHSTLSQSPSPSSAAAAPSLPPAPPSTRAPASVVVPMRSPCPLASIMNPSPPHRDDAVGRTSASTTASGVSHSSAAIRLTDAARYSSGSGASREVSEEADAERDGLVRPTYVAPVLLSARSAPSRSETRAPLSTRDATKRLAGLTLVPSLAPPMCITLRLGRRAPMVERDRRTSPSRQDAPATPAQQQQVAAPRVTTIQSMDEAHVLIKAEQAPIESNTTATMSASANASVAVVALPRPQPHMLSVQSPGRDASRKRPRPHATVASLPALAVATTPSTGSLCFSIKPVAPRASSEVASVPLQKKQQTQQLASARPSAIVPPLPASNASNASVAAPPSSSSSSSAQAPQAATTDSVAGLSRSAVSTKGSPRRDSNDSASASLAVPATVPAPSSTGAGANTALSFRVKLPAVSAQSSRKRPNGADTTTTNSGASASAAGAPKRSRTRALAATTLVAKAGGKDDENALSLLVLASAKRQ